MAAHLEPLATPLEGVSLIEAAAGTGKTYTITALYVRLLLERKLAVENILVVTYTNAATAELRERVRSRLVEVREAFLRGEGGDPFCRGLLERFAADPSAEKRLYQAIMDFDRAAIYTIHGFCQRTLADTAFEAGLPFEMDLVTDEQELLQEVVDDFWRMHVQDEPPGFLDYLRGRGVSPEGLASQISRWTGQPFLEIRAPNEPVGLESLEAGFHRCFVDARAAWRREREGIIALLADSDALNRNRYRPASLVNWAAGMDLYLGEIPGVRFDQFAKFTSGTLAASVKKGKEPPEHDFFDLCEALDRTGEQLDGAYADGYAALLNRLIAFGNAELRRRKRERRLLAYDDLLLNLHEALSGDEDGSLTRRINGQYRAALIDEFQDTDPLQYRIFDRIYSGTTCPVFLVGDPKQAIYSFRGADIFAYLRAREGARHRFTLATNWRSDPALVEAVNGLFDQPHGPFLFPHIEFESALPADQPRPPLSGGSVPNGAVCVGMLEDGLNVEGAGREAAAWTASKIAGLLGGEGESGARLDGRPLEGGDIAVLVRSHRQGIVVREALARLSINSVQRSQQNVFLSPEAEDLERVMRAALEPGRIKLVRGALSTDLMGWSGDEIEALNGDDERFEEVLDQFRLLHRLWGESGFMAMAGELMERGETAERLLGFVDGERRVTNLRHLLELLHGESMTQRGTMESLVNWLYRRRNRSAPGEEAYQLRLESDEQLVQVVTIHKSKGLQYPVVFCPFTWYGKLESGRGGDACLFHDPARGYDAVLELGSQGREEERVHVRREELAEDLRLLYVSLTRAKHRCYLAWGSVAGADQSALGWLLHPPGSPASDDAVERMKGRFKGLTGEEMEQRLDSLAAARGVGIAVEKIESGSPPGAPVRARDGRRLFTPLSVRSPRRQPGTGSRMTSFSSLTSAHAPFDRPDHDADIPAGGSPAGESLDIFHFPRGAVAGSCLHAIFERLDFNRYTPGALSGVVGEALAAFGFDPKWAPCVEAMVNAVLTADLEPGSGIRLRDVTPDRRLVEMEFHFPLKRLDREGLVRVMETNGAVSGGDPAAALERLRFSPVEGYLKGFIDLVFESGGRFYLVDYKSNWLGDRPSDYLGDRLDEAIARHDYYLQYLLYTVALHRYLGQRIPGYAYERHFGGIFYLFVRGVDPSSDLGPGVFRERPSIALIEALDRLLSGGASR